MDDASSTHSILDTLRTVEFRLGLKGYNVDEVDEYLEKAAVEAEQVQERLRTTNERLHHATEQIAQLEVELQGTLAERSVASQPSTHEASSAATGAATQETAVTHDALQRTLLLAQKFVEQTKRESEAEAAQVVSRAEERARALLAQAEERARQLASETEERLRAEVARLEQARARLGSDVEAMSRHMEEERTKIRASLVEALRWMDERMQAPVDRKGERGAEGAAAAQAAHRKSPGEEARSAAKAEPGGAAGGTSGSGGQVGAGAGSPGTAGTTAGEPQVTSSAPGAPPRQAAIVPAHPPAPAADRTQAPVGASLGALNGGLFEAARDEANGPEGNRPGE